MNGNSWSESIQEVSPLYNDPFQLLTLLSSSTHAHFLFSGNIRDVLEQKKILVLTACLWLDESQ